MKFQYSSRRLPSWNHLTNIFCLTGLHRSTSPNGYAIVIEVFEKILPSVLESVRSDIHYSCLWCLIYQLSQFCSPAIDRSAWSWDGPVLFFLWSLSSNQACVKCRATQQQCVLRNRVSYNSATSSVWCWTTYSKNYPSLAKIFQEYR